MIDEIFDIYDEEMKKIGQASRQEAYSCGLWHQTFHCWIVSRTEDSPQIVLQMRHREKELYPDMFIRT